MSEYQYYEFQAIDRPLTAQEQATLRTYSSRATITSGRFAVDYSWGDFKGNAAVWMEKYFDAFLYLANWGTHELMLRLPRAALPLETAKQCCASDFASARAKGDQLVLAFRSEDERGRCFRITCEPTVRTTSQPRRSNARTASAPLERGSFIYAARSDARSTWWTSTVSGQPSSA